jgi:uncharacterized protein YchJ
MIAGNAHMFKLPQTLNALMRVRAVAYYIAETPYLIETTPVISMAKHCLESRQIAMNVAQDCITHTA